MVARRPDHLREPAGEQIQSPLDRVDRLRDITRDNQPVVIVMRLDTFDDLPVARVGDMEIADRKQ
jgi:hypothetical protein